MTDEPEQPDDELGDEIECEGPSDADWYEVEDGYLVFPRGVGWFADEHGASAIKVKMPKGGSVEILVMDGEGWNWRDVTAQKRKGELTVLKK